MHVCRVWMSDREFLHFKYRLYTPAAAPHGDARISVGSLVRWHLDSLPEGLDGKYRPPRMIDAVDFITEIYLVQVDDHWGFAGVLGFASSSFARFKLAVEECNSGVGLSRISRKARFVSPVQYRCRRVAVCQILEPDELVNVGQFYLIQALAGVR